MQSLLSNTLPVQDALNTYTNFEGFSGLRQQARENTPESIKKVAKQFESLFIQMMLKGMRDTVPEGSLFDGKQQRMYQDMYDKQISINMSNAKGIGLADVIERQLISNDTTTQKSRTLADYQSKALHTPTLASLNKLPEDSSQEAIKAKISQIKLAQRVASNDDLDALKSQTVTAGQDASLFDKVQGKLQTAWQSAESFIDDIWPYAQRAANQLGINADVLVAQSALETGWGKFISSFDDGQVSYSLFGIKADTRWSGKTISVNTLEFRQGAMQREQAKFRAYDSVGEAFNDYVNFIEAHPRYQQALQKGYNPEAYARELQQAGYATDPDYAKKIERIRNSELLQQQNTALKNGSTKPLI